MTRLRNVALAGAGMISLHHLRAWRSVADRVRVVGIFDPDPSRAKTRAGEFDIPTVYPDPEALLGDAAVDIVDVASPRATHAFWVRRAVAGGKAVLCQKPLAPDLEQALSLADEIGDAVVMVHENWRFRPWYRETKAWIESGELGEIQSVAMTMHTAGLLPDEHGQRPALLRQPFFQELDRLMIAEILIHHLDVLRYLAGEMKVVAARTRSGMPVVPGEVAACIMMETASGAPATVTGSIAAAGFPPRGSDKLEITGSRASIRFDGEKLHLLSPRTPRLVEYDPADGYQASFDNVMAHFVDRLDRGLGFETSVADNLETLRLVEDAYRCASLPPQRR
ncbi:MAG: Gfo/Idh/MocA family oxidoreductase [Nitratireductor sp.]|nr:Gfo/Idh/MocA family oxidoreductase [Nitratireductor sp.]